MAIKGYWGEGIRSTFSSYDGARSSRSDGDYLGKPCEADFERVRDVYLDSVVVGEERELEADTSKD